MSSSAHESQWKFCQAKDLVPSMSGPHPVFTCFHILFMICHRTCVKTLFFLRTKETFQALLAGRAFSYFFMASNLNIQKMYVVVCVKSNLMSFGFLSPTIKETVG